MSSNIKAYDYILKPGYVFVPDDPIILGAILGNGLVVTIFDIKRKKGGMCHFIRPKPRKDEKRTAIYGEIAIPLLLQLFLKEGSLISNLKAHIVGGAIKTEKSSFFFKNSDLGEENLKIARKILEKYKVNSISYMIGGYQGKKILFNTFTNELFSANVNKIRNDDWL